MGRARKVTPLRRPAAASLAARVRDARQAWFVGRDAVLSDFDALCAPTATQPIWFIHGPGGIGKSLLLTRLIDEAAARGIATARLDACRVAPNAAQARHALERAMGGCPLARFGGDAALALLVIDTLEAWAPLHAWLRESFLAEAGANVRIVLAGRQPPACDWRSDPGWRAVTRTIALGALSDAEAGEYLARRGVPEARHAEVRTFSAGHPLALALATDAALAGRELETMADTGADAVSDLVARFVSDAGCDTQRQALDACAVVREMNVDLLAAMLDGEQAEGVFDWLAGLSFMETVPGGLRPHALVRTVLMHDLARRAPARYEAFARAAFEWTVHRLRDMDRAPWSRAMALALDAMYALRGIPIVASVFQAADADGLIVDAAATESDHTVIAELIARHEGSESARRFNGWLGHAGASVHVVRDAHGQVRGGFLKLDLESLSDADLADDPVTRHAAGYLADALGLGPGDHQPLIRHWVTADNALTHSPEKTAILMAIATYNLVNSPRVTAQVFLDNSVWRSLAAGLGIRRAPDSGFDLGEARAAVDYFDWSLESPVTYYAAFARRLITFAASQAGAAVPRAPVHELDQSAFRHAALTTIKRHARPERLADSPLLATALVRAAREAGNEDDAVAALRDVVRNAAESLADSGAPGEHHYKVLHRAHLQPAAGQKAAAAALNMGYSTFRRHLAEAREALVDELWRREQALR